MINHPCKGMSQAAINAFELISINEPPDCSGRTIEALLKRGLIEEAGKREVGRDRFGKIELPVYCVPLAVHIQFCKWAAENVSDDELNEGLSIG